MSRTAAVVFWDEERGREDRYDFSQLSLPEPIRHDFAKAFKSITGAYRATGRTQAWRNLRRFAMFLRKDPAGVDQTIADPNLLLHYKADLLESKVLRKTARSQYNFARQLVSWLVENAPRGPWRSAIVVRATSMMAGEVHNVRDNAISPSQLRRIAEYCKREVDRVIARFAARERAERGEEIAPADLGGIPVRKFKAVIAFEAQDVYTQRDFHRIHRGGLAAIRLRNVEPYRALTIRSALPYYLLLIISTCGNPMGIKDLGVDCIREHPTDPLKRRIVWDKPRARREQAYDVIANGTYSAVRCVNDLLRLTAPIRRLALPADARKLMITRVGHRARRISVQSLHNALTAFREEHSLPYFTFADLRKAAAVAVDQFAQSARTVKRLLQHRSTRTSRVYLQARRSVERRYEGVLRFQGQMVALAQTTSRRSVGVSGRAPYGTATGLGCRDPLSGIAPGSVKNQACLQWLRCCQCPNAIVTWDDPRIVARIIRAAQSLQEMRLIASRSADRTQHFESAFRPTLHVIENQILPKIPATVRARAEMFATSLPGVPFVE